MMTEQTIRKLTQMFQGDSVYFSETEKADIIKSVRKNIKRPIILIRRAGKEWNAYSGSWMHSSVVKCPNCKDVWNDEGQHKKRCGTCGQLLSWKDITRKDKEDDE